MDLNATQADIRAGYSAKTANRTASENMSKP
ncbi:terminase small subunit, partial [Salmonella enterica]|nr:terminase small subunit [Salmonella enterica]